MTLPAERALPLTEIGVDRLDPVLQSPCREEPLYLVTGYLDDARKPLTATHDRYPLFALIRANQDTFDADSHRHIWEASVRLWPRADGRSPTAERKAFAVLNARSQGLSDDQIAARMPNHPNWRDQRAFAQATDMDRLLGSAQVLLPRVVTQDEAEGIEPIACLINVGPETVMTSAPAGRRAA